MLRLNLDSLDSRKVDDKTRFDELAAALDVDDRGEEVVADPPGSRRGFVGEELGLVVEDEGGRESLSSARRDVSENDEGGRE